MCLQCCAIIKCKLRGNDNVIYGLKLKCKITVEKKKEVWKTKKCTQVKDTL